MIGEENETEVGKGHEVETQRKGWKEVVQKLIVIEEKA